MTCVVDDIGLQAGLRPDKQALCDLASGNSWTYQQLHNEVGRCATYLKSHNVGNGDRVAVLSRNRAELIILHYACARLGSLFSPLNWRLSKSEIQLLVEDAEPTLFFSEPDFDSAPEGYLDINKLLPALSELSPGEPGELNGDDVSLLLFTSGTSGRPKGVLLTENNLAESAINSTVLCCVTENSVYLVDSPMFHIIGLIACVRPPLMCGGTVLVSNGFDPEITLERLADPALSVSHYFCVPQMAKMLRDQPAYDPSRLRKLTAVFTGGALHPEADIRSWLKDDIAIVDGFGMSEAGTVFGMPLDKKQIDRYAGAAGINTRRVKIRIVDENDKDVPIGESGELLLKGLNVTQGYWQREDETRNAFTEDGWFRTGDVVRANDEGFHWIVGRRKEMYISGGENVYPAEIEAAMIELADIQEAAVVGVEDPQWGEVGHLFWVPRSDASISEDAIRNFLNSRLARYKIPKHFTQLDALPRNGAGKILKKALTEL
jgi:fatty-acyl-CoA synthase